MNKFIKTITAGSNATLKSRAEMMSEDARIEQDTLLNKYKREKSHLKIELQQLLDLAPDSTTSLNPRSKDWDSKQWACRIQEIKLKLINIDIALKAAQETYDEFFTEETEEESK